MVLIINLNTTVDKTLIVNDFKIDHIYRPEEMFETGGGKGINVARVLNTFGVENTVIGFAGGEKINTILNTLYKEKINFIPVPIYGNSRICTLIIDKKNRTETVINENGPKISEQEIKSFFQLFHKVFSDRIKYLVISGSIPPGVPFDFYRELIKYAQKKNVFTIADTFGQPLSFTVKAAPDVIKPNQDELKKLLDLNIINYQHIKKALVDFSKQGIRYPIVTLGKQGSIAFNSRTNKIIKAIPPQIVKLSTIGSGDSFTAGLVYSFINNYDFSDTLKMATAASAANTLKIGAGVLNRKDIFKLFRKVEII